MTFIIKVKKKIGEVELPDSRSDTVVNGTTNIQTMLDIVPHFLMHVWCYRSHGIPYVGYQVLKVIELNL
jgi:hypothetical protein